MRTRVVTTLLDVSFLQALADRSSPRHDEIVATYRRLLDEFEGGGRRLLALDDHLRLVDAEQLEELFAPVRPLHVAGQHRRAADAIVERSGFDRDVAIVLVMLRREGIGSLGTVDARFTPFAIDLIPPAPIGDGGNAQVAN